MVRKATYGYCMFARLSKARSARFRECNRSRVGRGPGSCDPCARRFTYIRNDTNSDDADTTTLRTRSVRPVLRRSGSRLHRARLSSESRTACRNCIVPFPPCRVGGRKGLGGDQAHRQRRAAGAAASPRRPGRVASAADGVAIDAVDPHRVEPSDRRLLQRGIDLPSEEPPHPEVRVGEMGH